MEVQTKEYATLTYEGKCAKIAISETEIGMTALNFRDLCMRMALAIGYQHVNVQEAFNEGEEYIKIVENLRAEIDQLEEKLDARN